MTKSQNPSKQPQVTISPEACAMPLISPARDDVN